MTIETYLPNMPSQPNPKLRPLFFFPYRTKSPGRKKRTMLDAWLTSMFGGPQSEIRTRDRGIPYLTNLETPCIWESTNLKRKTHLLSVISSVTAQLP